MEYCVLNIPLEDIKASPLLRLVTGMDPKEGDHEHNLEHNRRSTLEHQKIIRVDSS